MIESGKQGMKMPRSALQQPTPYQPMSHQYGAKVPRSAVAQSTQVRLGKHQHAEKVPRSTTASKTMHTVQAVHRKNKKDQFNNPFTRMLRAAGIEKANHSEVYPEVRRLFIESLKKFVKDLIIITQHDKRNTIMRCDLALCLKFYGIAVA